MAKRAREEPEEDWSIVFEDVSQLRAVVDACATVTPRVRFKVVRRAEHHFLEVNSKDVGMTCCITARLALDNVHVKAGGNDEDFSFYVGCSAVSSALCVASCAHFALTMKGFINEAKIVLTMHDPEERTHEACTEVPLYDEEDHEDSALISMEFNMMLEVEPALLREMIKMARKAHTENVRIRVHLQDVGSKKVSLVIFSIDGDFKHEQRFCHETARDDDGSTIVRAATDVKHKLLNVASTEPAFEGVFPVEKIDAFLKPLACRMLVAKLNSNWPLLLHHKLSASNEESYIDFLVPPLNEEA